MDDLGPQETPPTVEREKLAFEREKWEAEQRRLDREFTLREKELALKRQEARRSRWWNPLIIVIVGATIAAGGNAYVSRVNSQGNLELETLKAESARIFEVVKTGGNPDVAAKNLSFLLDTGLIQNATTVDNIKNYLSKRKQGEGVSLPAASVGGIGSIFSTDDLARAASSIGRNLQPVPPLNQKTTP